MIDGMTEPAPDLAGGTRGWTFLTNHGHVLLAIARDPNARLPSLLAYLSTDHRDF